MTRLAYIALFLVGLIAIVYALMSAGSGKAPDNRLEAFARGEIEKLDFSKAGTPAASSPFYRQDGTPVTLQAYQGKVVLVNFWATWCAPCRKEMPQLNALQKEFGGDDFQVVTIATGRNSPAGIVKFFEEAGVDSLPRHQDPKQALASQMGIFGLPITVLINPEGEEIARLRGDAVWDSDSAKAIIKALIDSRADS